MKNKATKGIILLMVAMLLSGCGTAKATEKEQATSNASIVTSVDIVNQDSSEDAAWTGMDQTIIDSDMLSGVMQFGQFKFELGDKLFKFEDQGFKCRQNDFDTVVKAHSSTDIVIYFPISTGGSGDTETFIYEYLYLRGYNPTDADLAMRDCDVCYVKDDKTNANMYIGTSRGVTRGMTEQQLIRKCGATTKTTVNNDYVYCYTDGTKTCNVFVNISSREVDCVEQYINAQTNAVYIPTAEDTN